MLGWGLSSTIGAAAGIFIANLTLLDPNMMAGVLIYAFAAAVLGGLTNPAGAVIGGLVMGLVESIAGSSSLIGSELKTPFAFAVFVAILLIKPGGLWGKVAVTRV
jgi:branched-chain amino acid transport system permease protein